MNSNDAPTAWPRLFSSIVFNLRSPLAVITGYSRMLQSERVGPLTEQQRKVSQELEKTARRLQDMAAQMATLVSATEGRLQRQVEVVELGSVVREAVASVVARSRSDVGFEIRAEDSELVEANKSDLIFAAETVFACVLRTLKGTDGVVWVTAPVTAARAERWVIVAAPDQLERALDPNNLEPLTDSRTSLTNALEMGVACRLIAAGGGLILRFREQIPGAVIALPEASAK